MPDLRSPKSFALQHFSRTWDPQLQEPTHNLGSCDQQRRSSRSSGRARFAWSSAVATAVLLAACATTGSDGRAEQSVQIKRDAYGVPRIYAQDTYGLFYGYAYAIAGSQ